jgi:hypothetical protein
LGGSIIIPHGNVVALCGCRPHISALAPAGTGEIAAQLPGNDQALEIVKMHAVLPRQRNAWGCVSEFIYDYFFAKMDTPWEFFEKICTEGAVRE